MFNEIEHERGMNAMSLTVRSVVIIMQIFFYDL
jgi:hypothetical protein